jgi:hypothetical protein
MLDFLSQEIKDHEHVFEGSILEKRKIVKCLVERMKTLNESICPDGTIMNYVLRTGSSGLSWIHLYSPEQ